MKEDQRVEWKEWGRGIDPKPEFRWDSGPWAVFPYAPEHAALSREVGRTTPITTPIPTNAATPIAIPERMPDLLRTQPKATIPQLSRDVGISLDGVKYHLRKLMDSGVVRHVGPSRSGHWEVLK